VHLRRERASLVNAISSMSTSGHREAARRFLEGLSADELQYIAAYFGARLLEPRPNGTEQSRNEVAHQIERYEGKRKTPQRSNGSKVPPESNTVSHRMIVLLEYLRACNMRSKTAAVRANAACA
jgi:hypothetical protein